MSLGAAATERLSKTVLAAGEVHWSRDRTTYREILDIAGEPERRTVTYHVIVANLRNSEQYRRFDRLAPDPTKREHEQLTRLCAGVPIGRCAEAQFRQWTGGVAQLDPKFKHPGRSMADLCLERVIAKGINGISFERALSYDAARMDFNLRAWGLPFVFTFWDGSRVAYAPALVFSEVDKLGQPLAHGRKCLDLRWEYGPENTPRIVREDFKKWLPHIARSLSPSL